jgi:hypothetical protein
MSDDNLDINVDPNYIVDQSFVVGAGGEIVMSITEKTDEYARSAGIIKDETDGYSADRTRRMTVSVPPRMYNHWERLAGKGCWSDKNFVRSFIREHPEFSTSNGRL